MIYFVNMYPPALFECFRKFCDIRQNSNIEGSTLDLSMYDFFYPTTLLPLLGYLNENSLKALVNQNIYGYVSTILPELVTTPNKVKKKKSYALRYLVPENKSLRDSILDEIIELTGTAYGGMNAFDYLLSELTDNIYQHSNFNLAFLMAQKYEKLDFTEVCVFDDGISIPKSFEDHDFNFDEDYEALNMAINGKSTDEEFEGRGWGINTIVKMFTEAVNGEMLMVSRSGATFVSKNREPKNYSLEKDKYMDGTMVSLRVPKKLINAEEYLI